MAISLTPPVITHRAHTSKRKMRPRPQINATKRRSYGADALTAAAWLTVTMKVAGAATTRRTRPPIFCDDAPGARWVRRVQNRIKGRLSNCNFPQVTGRGGCGKHIFDPHSFGPTILWAMSVRIRFQVPPHKSCEMRSRGYIPVGHGAALPDHGGLEGGAGGRRARVGLG